MINIILHFLTLSYCLLNGDKDVDNSEVIFQSVSNEDASTIHQEPELLVGGLQSGQVLGAVVGVKVSWLDT